MGPDADAPSTQPPGKCLILVVDDDPVNLQMMCVFLEDFGYRVATSQDGADALVTAKETRPDLILLDIRMPRMDGFETCARLQADETLRDTPVIFMSALNEVPDKVRGFREGAVDYITKPFQQDEALARIRVQLHLHLLQKQLTQQNAVLQGEIAARELTERALQQAHDELESRVAQRTAELADVNRTLRVLSECNQTVVRAKEETPLLGDVCRHLVEYGEYSVAWVGLVGEQPDHAIRTAAWAGAWNPADKQEVLGLSSIEQDTSPVGRAIRTGDLVVARSLQEGAGDSSSVPVSTEDSAASCVVFPLRSDGGALGALAIFSDRPDAFPGKELDLLLELAGDLSFGMATIRARIQRERAEAALSNAHRKLEDIIEFLPDATFVIDQDRKVIAWNHALEVMTGTTKQEVLGQGDSAYAVPFYGQRRPILIDLVGLDPGEIGPEYCNVRKLGATLIAEAQVPLLREGRGAFIWIAASPLLDSQGAIVGAIESVRDITDLKQTEQALVAAEEKYRDVVSHATEAIAVIQDGHIRFANPAMERGLGVRSSELLNHQFIDFIHPDDRALLMETHRRRMAGLEVPPVTTFRFVGAQGQVGWAESRAVTFTWEGRPAALTFMSIITEAHNAQEELRRTEERFRATFEQAAVGITHVAPDGRLLRINQRFCEIVGRPHDELQGLTFQAITHPDDLESDLELMQDLLAGGRSSYSMEKRYIRKDGQAAWAHLTVSLVSTPAGDPDYFISVIEDIAARKEAEAALQRERALTTAIIDSVPGLLYVYDDQGGLVRWNRNAELVTGYTASELKGRPVLSFFEAEDTARVAQTIDRIVKGTYGEVEASLVTRAGSHVPFYLNGTQLIVDDCIYVVGVGLDLTERRRIQAALEERLRFEELVSALSAGLAKAEGSTMDDIIVAGLRQLAEMLGVDRATLYLRHPDGGDVVATHCWAIPGTDLIPAGTNTDYIPWITDKVLAGEVATSKDLGELAPEALTDHETLLARGIASWLVVPLVDAKGVLGAVSLGERRQARTWTDAEITRLRLVGDVFLAAVSRHRAEENKRRLQHMISEAAYEWTATFDAVHSALVLTDTEGVIKRANLAARNLTGLAWDEFLGRRLGEFSQIKPLLMAAEVAGMAARSGAATAARVEDPGASKIWNIEGVRLESTGDRIILVIRDITSIVTLEESVQRRETMAAMGALVGGVAHEVRNPLFAISGLLDALDARFGRSEQLGEFLDGLRKEADRLAALMRALLEYGRPVSDDRVPTPPGVVINEAALICQREADLRQITVVVDAPDDIPLLPMDRMRMVEVFRNLVENGIQYSAAGGQVRIKASEADLEGWVEVSVHDSGPGFAEAERERIFEPFYSRRAGGTGLGLSIVHRIVLAHGGKVEAATHPSGGGVVTVRLPG